MNGHPMDLTQRAAKSGAPEWRSYPAQFEIRGLTGSVVEVSGCASTYDQPYEMHDSFGPYTEVARAGMCAKTIAEGADVAYLANHTGLTMARTKAGTLDLYDDPSGLQAFARMNTARSDVRDLVTAIEDGNVDQMSFAFRVVRQQWSPDYDQRDLIEVNLNRGDVSAVNFGANPFTSVGVQRAFKSRSAAQINNLANELRAGKALSPADVATLTRVLHLIASADDAVDAAQPMLATLLGVPNPDAADEAQQNAAPQTVWVRDERGGPELKHVGSSSRVIIKPLDPEAVSGFIGRASAADLAFLETLREQIALEAEQAA